MSTALLEVKDFESRADLLSYSKGEYRKALGALFGILSDDVLKHFESQGKIVTLEAGEDDAYTNALGLELPESWESLIKGMSEDVEVNRVVLNPHAVVVTASLLTDEAYLGTLRYDHELFFTPSLDSEKAYSRRVFLDVSSGLYFMPTMNTDRALCRYEENAKREIYRIGLLTDQIPGQALLDLPKLVEAVYKTPGSRIVIP